MTAANSLGIFEPWMLSLDDYNRLYQEPLDVYRVIAKLRTLAEPRQELAIPFGKCRESCLPSRDPS